MFYSQKIQYRDKCMFYSHMSDNGVTSNSGSLEKYPSRALPPCSISCLPLPSDPYLFMSFPSYSQLCPSLLPMTARGSVEVL